MAFDNIQVGRFQGYAVARRTYPNEDITAWHAIYLKQRVWRQISLKNFTDQINPLITDSWTMREQYDVPPWDRNYVDDCFQTILLFRNQDDRDLVRLVYG